MTHPEDARLQDYVDGRLEPDAAGELEDHLEACGTCRGRVGALRDLTARLGALPREFAPRRDLRPPAPAGERAHDRSGSGPTAGAWLRAAAVAVALLGAGAALWSGPLGPGGAETTASGDPVVRTYEEAARELEAELEGRKDELSPAAVRALEASLASVDAAIRELERTRDGGAAGDDLGRGLAARYETRLEVLRSALRRLEET